MGEKEIREYLRELGRRGAKATNTKLTAEQRKESASRAAKARWAKLEKTVAEIKEGAKDLRKLSAHSRKRKKA